MKEMREKAVIWVVGDSTLSPFEDQSYFPREGYGEELDQYLNADVYNLAVSGASSRDFTAMENYRILLTGNDKVPAMGSLKDREQFLLIGFGHNDEKQETGDIQIPMEIIKQRGVLLRVFMSNILNGQGRLE